MNVNDEKLRAALLEKAYAGATLVHMDDFFLQLHQRTQKRFETLVIDGKPRQIPCGFDPGRQSVSFTRE